MKSKQRGVTITEAMLVLGVASAMVATAYVGYKKTSDDSMSQQFVSDSMRMMSDISMKWGAQSDYLTATSANVVALGLVPSSFSVTGTTIYTPFTTTLSLSSLDALNVAGDETASDAAAPDAIHKLVFPVNSKVCPDLVKAAANLAVHIKVGTTSVKTQTTALNYNTTITQCAATASPSVTVYLM